MKCLFINKNGQRGFTLIEVIIAIAISGILGGGLVTAMYQIGNVNSIDNARVTAVKQVENAIHYLNRDIQMSQTVQANGQGYWLRLTWITWDTNEGVEVIYKLVNNQLTRSYSIDGGSPQISIIGRFITSVSALPPNLGATPPEKAWTFQITASTSSKFKQAAETRQLKIIPRPGS